MTKYFRTENERINLGHSITITLHVYADKRSIFDIDHMFSIKRDVSKVKTWSFETTALPRKTTVPLFVLIWTHKNMHFSECYLRSFIAG